MTTLRLCAFNLKLYLGSLIALIALMSSISAASPNKSPESRLIEIFQFPSDKAGSFENVHIRPNNHLLLTAVSSGDLYTIDPSAKNPQPHVVASLPGASGLVGIATVDAVANIYAIGGGQHIPFGFTPGTTAVWVVHIGENNEGVVLHTIPVDALLNGMDSLPSKPHVVLAADSKGGRVMRINTQTQHVDVAFEDPSLAPSSPSDVKLGINGARIRDDYFYFTNSNQGTFGRIPIDCDGNKVGDVDIIATLLQKPATFENAYDDFIFDHAGNAYVTQHSSSCVKITSKGEQTVFLNGTGYQPGLIEPTSAAFSLDGKTLYFCTVGTTVGATVYGGQLLKVTL